MRAVAIQMDCFVVSPSEPPRNDSLLGKGRWHEVALAFARRETPERFGPASAGPNRPEFAAPGEHGRSSRPITVT